MQPSSRHLLRLILLSSGVIFGADDEASTLTCASVDDFHDINEFLTLCNGPVDLVIVAGTKVDHDMLVAVEKHGGARVVQFVHLVKVGYLGDVHQVDYGKVLYGRRDFVQGFVHLDAGGIGIVAKADDDDAVFFR